MWDTGDLLDLASLCLARPTTLPKVPSRYLNVGASCFCLGKHSASYGNTIAGHLLSQVFLFLFSFSFCFFSTSGLLFPHQLEKELQQALRCL